MPLLTGIAGKAQRALPSHGMPQARSGRVGAFAPCTLLVGAHAHKSTAKGYMLTCDCLMSASARDWSPKYGKSTSGDRCKTTRVRNMKRTSRTGKTACKAHHRQACRPQSRRPACACPPLPSSPPTHRLRPPIALLNVKFPEATRCVDAVSYYFTSVFQNCPNIYSFKV